MGKIISKIQHKNNIYLDTSIYIYYFENNPKFAQISENIFTNIINHNKKIQASTFLTLELLIAPIRKNNSHLIQQYQKLNTIFPNFTYHDITNDINAKAAHIRAKYNFSTPDSIHLATAINNNCDLFITNDIQLKKIKEIETSNI